MALRFLLLSLCVLLEPVTEIGGLLLKPVLSGPSEAYVRSQVQFDCAVPGWSSPLTFELLKDAGDLIAAESNVKVTFTLQVTEGSAGEYYCRLTSGGQTSNSIHLHAVIPVVGARLSSEPDPAVIYEGQKLVLRCLVRKGTRLSFTWYQDAQLVTSSSELHRLSGDTLTVERATAVHAGIYSCTAQNQMSVNPRFSSSRNLHVTVKKHMSAPSLSFSVFSNGSGLTANISCGSERGSPPVTFRLMLDGRELEAKREDSLESWFLLPVSEGRDLGAARCQAQTDTQQLISDPVRLLVVPVGGAVRVTVQYLHDADGTLAAARLRCVPDRGTFPAFSWSLNRSSLPAEGSAHAVAGGGQILILTEVRAGVYGCRARDSYNLSSVWVESEDVLVQRTDLAAMSVEAIALIFCGFLSTVIVSGSFFVYWSTKRSNDACKRHSHQDVIQSEMMRTFPAAGVSSEPVEMKTVIVELEA
ncbi:Fc receptor-like protein 5 isoform X2 [Puntigrus tetrazona]|uniref:Fc receptor-like protein 5 isoform X2 n=1 Tax=Puntigrus tetrazona TaxID=1606681 RepID=UPI001C88FE59|nr:Fc receptor-like protein 5 isoform X2 [Puntigrus tetrazona]